MTVGLCRLDALADIRLGVKTFLNPFFYVTRERIDQFGIEEDFLEPVFRTKDATLNRFIQDSSQTSEWIFLCDQKLDALAGTGAAAYITWGSKQRHPVKNGQPGGLWKDTPAVKPETRLWYQNQAMPPPARIVLLKAFNDYFAPFLLDKEIRVDQRFNQVVARSSVDEELLIALLLSTWFVMTIETRGRTAMGQGALEVPTETLRELEVPDIRGLTSEQKSKWIQASKDLLKDQRRPAAESPSRPSQQALDRAVLESLDFDVGRIEELYRDTGRMRDVRKLLAQGRGAIKRERFATDIAGVARDIATETAPLLKSKRFPEDFMPPTASTQPVQLGNAPIRVEATGVVGLHHVVVSANSEVIFESDLIDPIGELFVRAVQMNRRDFALPTSEKAAGEALKAFDGLMKEVASKLEALSSGVSGAASTHLRELAEADLNVPVARVLKPISTDFKEDL
jgi:hypothetical protein